MSLSLGVRIASGLVIALLAVIAAIAAPAPSGTPPGWATYERFCLACHGERGDGAGPAAPYSRGRPRDFTRGEFAWRSTPIGSPPTRSDLRDTIRNGVGGTSMHGFRDALTPAQIDEVIDVVLAFGPKVPAANPIALPPRPAKPGITGAASWTSRGCAACHGASGFDGRVPLPIPLHRPDPGFDPRRGIAMTIATGTGAMPGYALPAEELWALADHVLALNPNMAGRSSVDPCAMPQRLPPLERAAIELDRTAKTPIGLSIPPQGSPPPTLSTVEASLYAHQCARCHPDQYRAWNASIHRGATSPGYLAQTFAMAPDRVANCRRCHAPLAEQASEPALHAQGVSCAGCHVRNWTRHGPPGVDAELARSPTKNPAYPLVTDARYDRGDFCMPCHQLAPRHAVDGRPLLDTFREWLDGPYLPRGVQCQSCHMPEREHSWRGIHDPAAVRRAISLAGRVTGSTVTVQLRNTGAGHYFPTTPTPAVYLTITANGETVRHRIGRAIEAIPAGWRDLGDTRIAPGATATFSHAFRAPVTSAKITVEVYPDDYYTMLYTNMLKTELPAARRQLYEQALARAKAAEFTALEMIATPAPVQAP